MTATNSLNHATRLYNRDIATRTAIGAASSAAIAFGQLGFNREVMFVASARCMIKFGASDVAAAAVADTDVMVIPADTMFHMRLDEGVTHFTVIRDTADGFLRCYPVA